MIVRKVSNSLVRILPLLTSELYSNLLSSNISSQGKFLCFYESYFVYLWSMQSYSPSY